MFNLFQISGEEAFVWGTLLGLAFALVIGIGWVKNNVFGTRRARTLGFHFRAGVKVVKFFFGLVIFLYLFGQFVS